MSHIQRVFALVFLGLTGAVNSAEIRATESVFGDPVLLVSGVIEKGDLGGIKEAVKDLIYKYDKAPAIEIDSAGGDAREAMRIGRFLREMLMSVKVYGSIVRTKGDEETEEYASLKDTHMWYYDIIKSASEPVADSDYRRCYSACVLIFYGAVERSLRDNVDQRWGLNRLRYHPVMGLHRPYYKGEAYSNLAPGDAVKAYDALSSEVREYLLEMGAPTALIDRMFRHSSEQIDLVRKEEFEQYYNRKAPFLEEWLISKCGSDDASSALSSDEAQIYFNVNEERKRKAKAFLERNSDNQDKWSVVRDIIGNYMPPGYSAGEIQEIEKKVGTYSRKVSSCKKMAVAQHQQKWAILN